MFDYRQAQFKSAGERAREVAAETRGGSDRYERTIEAYVVLAMLEYQRGRLEDAHSADGKGMEVRRERSPDMEQGNLGVNWMDWIISDILIREAAALMGDGHSVESVGQRDG